MTIQNPSAVDLDKELFCFSESEADTFTIRQAAEGVQIFWGDRQR